MRAFILSIVALAALTWGADYALHRAGFSATEMAAGPSVRPPLPR